MTCNAAETAQAVWRVTQGAVRLVDLKDGVVRAMMNLRMCGTW